MEDKKLSYEERLALAYENVDEDSPIWYEDDKCVGEVKLHEDTEDDQENDDIPEVFIEDCTGAILAPGRPQECEGNGENPQYECCCDECDYLMLCKPYLEKT